MSIINQMLKDLDDRHGAVSNAQFMESMSLRSGFKDRFYRQYQTYIWLVVFSICSLFFIKVFFSEAQSSINDSTTQYQANSVHEVKLPDLKVKQPDHQPTKNSLLVTGAEWRFTGPNSLELQLQLDGLPDNGVIKKSLESGETEFLLPLTKTAVALPVLDIENSPIDSYRVSQRGENFVVVVRPKSKTNISTSIVQGKGSEKSVAWVMKAEAIVEKKISTPKKESSVEKQLAINSTNFVKDIKDPVQPVKRKKATYPGALNYLQANRLAMALAELEAVLIQNETHHDARELLANLYLKSGRASEANLLLESGITMEPSRLSFRRMLADLLIASGELEKAARVLDIGAEAETNDATYQALQAAVAQRLSDHEKAVSYYMQALETGPKHSKWWMGLAISLEALDKREAAFGAYTTALDSGQLNGELASYVNSRLQDLR